MAYTLTPAQIDDAVAVALTYRIPTLVDGVYVATPLLKTLDSQERITADGGNQIEQPILYAKGPGGSYDGMDPFDTSDRQTMSMLQLKWKHYYATVVIDGPTRLKASGLPAVIDLVDAKMQAAELRLKDDEGGDIFLDGTGNFGKALDGLDIAIDSTGTYGGISRTVDAAGPAITAHEDSAGGDLTLPAMQSSFGAATYGNEHPNLIVMPQAQWDMLWTRLQPQQRFPQGALAELIAKAGFSVITFNGVPTVVDQKAPAGTVWFLNTNFVKFVAHQERANIEISGPLEPTNSDARVWKLMHTANLVVGGPRFQAKMTGLNS